MACIHRRIHQEGLYMDELYVQEDAKVVFASLFDDKRYGCILAIHH